MGQIPGGQQPGRLWVALGIADLAPGSSRFLGHLWERQKVLGVPHRWHSLPGKSLTNLELKHNTEWVENIHLCQASRLWGFFFSVLPPAPYPPAPKDAVVCCTERNPPLHQHPFSFAGPM